MAVRVSFNSIVPPNSATHLLAFREMKGYLVHQGFDSDCDIILNLFQTDDDVDEIARTVIDQKTEVAAFSVYLWNASMVDKICRRIKRNDAGMLTIAGGPHVSITAERTILESPVDLIVKGPGEEVIGKVLDRVGNRDFDWRPIPNLVYRENGEVIETETDDSFDVERQYYPLAVDDGDSPYFFYETFQGVPVRVPVLRMGNGAGNGGIDCIRRKRSKTI